MKKQESKKIKEKQIAKKDSVQEKPIEVKQKEEKKEEKSEEKKIVIHENKNLVKNFNSPNSSPSLRPIFGSPQSLENVVGTTPIKKIEEDKDEEIKYSAIKYDAKKNDYSFNSNSYITPSGKIDMIKIGRNEPEFKTENASFNRGLGDLAGVKEEKNDYHIRAGERVDITKRKSIFEIEQEKLGDIKSQKYYQ